MNTTLNEENVSAQIAKNESGQTIVEFVLLLASIVIISFSFMKLVNGEVAKKWERMANMVLDDKTQTLRLR